MQRIYFEKMCVAQNIYKNKALFLNMYNIIYLHCTKVVQSITTVKYVHKIAVVLNRNINIELFIKNLHYFKQNFYNKLNMNKIENIKLKLKAINKQHIK